MQFWISISTVTVIKLLNVTLNMTESTSSYYLSSMFGIYDVSLQEEILQYLTAENAG